jgi:Fe-Mn family superoxide dismutase
MSGIAPEHSAHRTAPAVGAVVSELLPYAVDALEPYISAETLRWHHGGHYRAQVAAFRRLINGTEFEQRPLESVIRQAKPGPLFDAAAEIWNHGLYWRCLSATGGGAPDGALAAALDHQFGSLSEFRRHFTGAAVGLFGSGWVWLVKNPDGTLSVETTVNAGTPVASGKHVLMACDVWEHAYYIDYRHARGGYLEAFWNRVDWRFVGRRYDGE